MYSRIFWWQRFRLASLLCSRSCVALDASLLAKNRDYTQNPPIGYQTVSDTWVCQPCPQGRVQAIELTIDG
jgi:hypothetical protein